LKNKPLYVAVKYVVVAWDGTSALVDFEAQTETLDASLIDSKVGQKADVIMKCVPRPYATAKLYDSTGNTTWTEEGKLSLPASHTFAHTGSMIYAEYDIAKSSDKCLSLHKLMVQSLYNRKVGFWLIDGSDETLKYQIIDPTDPPEITVGKVINSVEKVRIVFFDYDSEDLDGNLYVDSTGQYGYLIGHGHIRVTFDNLSDVSLTALAVGGGLVVGGALVGFEAIERLIVKIPGIEDTMEKVATALATSAKDVLTGYCAGWAAAIADSRINLADTLDMSLHAEVIQKALPAILGGAAASTIASLAAQVTQTEWISYAGSLGVGAGLAVIVHGILAISERWTYVYTHESA
jgi:hypothetical protein